MNSRSLRHLQKSLKKHWRRYRKELKRCQTNFSEEAIHATRVETRRLLSTVELLGGFLPAGRVAKVQHDLKRRLDIFDDLRDTQVHLLQVGKMRRVFSAAHHFHQYLLKRQIRLTKKTRKRTKEVTISRLGKLIDDCREKVEAQRKVLAPNAAAARLMRAVDRAFIRTKQLRARISPSDTRTIHRTRVAFKKFRYMVEELADYLPIANDKVLAEMRHYQAMMGDIQDAEVLLLALDKFLARKEIKPGPARWFREELARRRRWLIRAYLDAADQLKDFWPLERAAVS
jgi:CHAD domain-containing protein